MRKGWLLRGGRAGVAAELSAKWLVLQLEQTGSRGESSMGGGLERGRTGSVQEILGKPIKHGKSSCRKVLVH